jgi:hypothetical protein
MHVALVAAISRLVNRWGGEGGGRRYSDVARLAALLDLHKRTGNILPQ